MSLAQLLKDKRIERKNVLDAAGAILTKAATEKRSTTPEEVQEFETRHTAGDNLLAEIGRLEKQLEAATGLDAAATDTRSGGREDVTRETRDGGNKLSDADRKAMEKRCLAKWMRGGHRDLNDEERAMVTARDANMPEEIRALSAATGASGAYTVPTGQPYALDIALKDYGGLLRECGYIDTDSGIVLPYPTMNDTGNSGEVIAENTQVAGTTGGGSAQDPSFGIINFSAYMTDSGMVLLPIQLLQDSAFDPESWMNDSLRIRLGRKMNALATTGTGSNQPTGLVTAATVGKTAASATAVTYNELLDLEHSVDPAYRPGAKWMWNDLTLKAIKKLVDSNGRPLWIAGGVSEGVQGKRPDTFDGYEYAINQDMPAMATTLKSIAFGAFSKFKIRRVKQIQFLRLNERFIDKLQIGFLAFLRFDSNLIDAGTHPVSVLQQA